MLRKVVLVSLALLLIAPSLRAQMLGRVIPTGAGGGGGQTIALSDITWLGAMGTPAGSDWDFTACLTVRHVGGTTKLYTIGYAGGYFGKLLEFAPVADGSLATAAPFTNISLGQDYGDIWQNEIYLDVSSGGPVPPQSGIANTGVPQGCFWDYTGSYMYTAKTVSYNNTFDTADTTLAQSTIDFTAHTGTGIGMWKLWKPYGNGAGQSLTEYNTRWAMGILRIPAAWATSYTGSRPIGVWGGGGISIESNTWSLGPALFAVDPANLTAPTDHTYLNGSILPLLFYPNTPINHPLARPAGYTINDFDISSGAMNGAPNSYWSWDTGYLGSPCLVWVNGANKQGLLGFAVMGAGSVDTTVAASPTPTHGSLTLTAAADAHVGDMLRYGTDTTVGDPQYPFGVARIASVAGAAITLTDQTDGHGVGDSTGLPIAGSRIASGLFYEGGGTVVSKFYTIGFTYAQSIVQATAGGVSPWASPTTNEIFNFPGQTYPWIGTVPGGDSPAIHGCALDEVASPHRIYVYVKHPAVHGAGSTHLIYVGELND